MYHVCIFYAFLIRSRSEEILASSYEKECSFEMMRVGIGADSSNLSSYYYSILSYVYWLISSYLVSLSSREDSYENLYSASLRYAKN